MRNVGCLDGAEVLQRCVDCHNELVRRILAGGQCVPVAYRNCRSEWVARPSRHRPNGSGIGGENEVGAFPKFLFGCRTALCRVSQYPCHALVVEVIGLGEDARVYDSGSGPTRSHTFGNTTHLARYTIGSVE